MIKTVIFDIGNVLTYFQWEEFYKSFGFSEEVFEKLAKVTVKSPTWNELDRGVMSTEAIIDAFVADAPEIESEIRTVFSNINGIVTKADYAIPWIKRLKKAGYEVLVLSNFSEKAFYECKDALGFLEYTDGGILSYRDKVIKPDPAIYELILERYELVPGECVFIDDLQANLDGAAWFGIHTIQFKSQEQAEADLKEICEGCWE